MDAVRVPPSAWRTSQSTVICTSPIVGRSVTARSERPINRWISWVRPDCLPLAASRSLRSAVEPGSIEYSAVTQPRPVPRIHGGTRSSTDAVHRTRVRPNSTSTDPAANSVKSRVNASGRNSSGSRPSRRMPMCALSLDVRDQVGCGEGDGLAERVGALLDDAVRVEAGPQVGQHEAQRAAPRAAPRPASRADRWMGAGLSSSRYVASDSTRSAP